MDIRKLTDAMLRRDPTACADALGFNKVDGRIREAQGAVDNVLPMTRPATTTTLLEDARDLALGWERLFERMRWERDILRAAITGLYWDLPSAKELESRCQEALDAINREMPEQDNGGERKV